MPTSTTPDRDLLIRVDSKLDALTSVVGEIKAELERKVDLQRVEVLECRIESLERKASTTEKYVYMSMGAVLLLQAVFQFLMKH